MPASSFLALFDDIATLLDDVAALSKVAAKKTVGVLSDDLALNAEQVSGVRAERELPVVWAVAKGSFVNKLIIVPTALLISAFLPVMITVLMVIGGLYLCFEGIEKVAHKLFHKVDEDDEQHRKRLKAISDPKVDLVQLEKQKIKGAIRTDFILSAEIVVIVLGTVSDSSFSVRVAVVSALAFAITVGVYGIVAAIVKLDDLGVFFIKRARANLSGHFSGLQKFIGKGLLLLAPKLMRLLAVLGTAAMFLVGGGILVHSFPWLHHLVEQLVNTLPQNNEYQSVIENLLKIAADGVFGMLAGAICLVIWQPISRLMPGTKTA